MYAKTAVSRTRMLPGAAAVVCALFAAHSNAADKTIAVSMNVSPQGLDLSKPADARTFYLRLENAAWIVCTRTTRVGLTPVANQSKCYQQALGNAVHASNNPLVTRMYLGTHTLEDAAAHGIDVPAQIAAK